ncbi:MAG: vWA domain-containing protein [Nocardioidaceae bacterium]
MGSTGILGLVIGVLVGGIGVFVAADRLDGSTSDDPTEPVAAASSAPTLEGCEDTTAVSAVAPPVVVPMLQAAAADLCIELDVTEASGRDGVAASETTDLWVTDSSLWAAARKTDPGIATSIASSPIVGIADAETATQLGGRISWPALMSKERSVRIGFHDPTSTATGLLAAWPFLKAQRDLSDIPYEALALTANALSQPAIVGDSVLASPPAKMVLFAGEYFATPSDSVRVLRGREGESYMDFPAYNLATDADARLAIADLVTRLASAEVAAERADAHLRDPDGTAEFDTAVFGEATRRMQLPNYRSTIKLYGLGASGSTPGRILVLLDVSAAMAEPQANGSPLMDQVRTTALVAMASLYDHTAVGIWLYDGTEGHRELTPITSLGTGRKAIIEQVETIRATANPQGSLYETILAGYQALQTDYDPTAAQSLVVFTNSSADGSSGMTLRSLITQLKTQSDPDEHIRVMGVGFGQDADVDGLKEISAEMGGTSARVQGAVPMLGLFITMVGQVAAQG